MKYIYNCFALWYQLFLFKPQSSKPACAGDTILKINI